jgi:predicted RNase H-like HicB family nuclease
VIGWAITNYYLHKAYPDLVGTDLVSYAVFVALEFTAVFRPVPEGYVAFVEELPGANTQGATLDEARSLLEEAAYLVLEAHRTLAQEDLAGAEVIREPLKFSA